MLCLSDKSTQFCKTGNKYEVAINAFGHRLRMSYKRAVPTSSQNWYILSVISMHFRVFS